MILNCKYERITHNHKKYYTLYASWNYSILEYEEDIELAIYIDDSIYDWLINHQHSGST